MAAPLPPNFNDLGLKTSGVYAITCKETGKVYIGSSGNMHQRWRNHFWKLTKGRHWNCHLQRSWNKRRCGAFEFSVLERCPVDMLTVLEQAYTNSVSRHLRFGFRLVVESNRGFVHTPESRERNSAAHRGKVATPETRAKLSASHKGKTTPLEVRAKMSAAHRRRLLEPGVLANVIATNRRKVLTPGARAKMSRAHTGKSLTSATRAKIGAAHKGMVHTPEARARMSAARRGIEVTPDARTNLSSAMRGWWMMRKARAIARKRCAEQLLRS
jgi:group I intron endonuclease